MNTHDHDHRVQGLANDEVAPDWPAITDDDLTWLGTRHAALAGHCRVRWHSPRPMSAAALVESANGPVFVKRHHASVRSAAVLEEEHRFITHLAAADVPVVQLLRDHAGHTAVAQGAWTWEVHAVGDGVDLYRDAPSWTPIADVAHAREAGRMLATLHQAASTYRAPQRSTHMLIARDELIRADDPVALIEQQLPQRPGLAAYLDTKHWRADLQRDVLPLHARLAGRLQAEPLLWAHNDWHVSNLFWHASQHGDTISTVFDFGLASPTSALFDLATAIERNAIAWLDLERGAQAVHLDIALALLDGYRAVLPLSPERVHLLADLLPVVHLDFALSEVEYFQSATASVANADVAYHTFLLGHAEWFRTPPGQALLDALRAAA